MATYAQIYRLTDSYLPWQWGMSLHSVSPTAFGEIIEDIKDTIPAPRRTWHPDSRRWLFWDQDAIDTACRVCKQHGVTCRKEDDSRETLNRDVDDASPDPYAVLHLLPTAPPELVHAAYHLLAQRHHPDHGGSTEEMQRINAAAAQLAESARRGK